LRRGIVIVLVACALAGCAAPILPQRSKPGGSARWAETISLQRALAWSRQSKLCRVTGTGVGVEGWLPDRGGAWALEYWSPEKEQMLEVSVDSDGATRTRPIPPGPQRGRTLPDTWQDSPKVWAATRQHLQGEPINTFDAELGFDAEPQRFAGQAVWRIRFWQEDKSFETHVVGADARWLASY
jgi:hypothetical protein